MDAILRHVSKAELLRVLDAHVVFQAREPKNPTDRPVISFLVTLPLTCLLFYFRLLIITEDQHRRAETTRVLFELALQPEWGKGVQPDIKYKGSYTLDAPEVFAFPSTGVPESFWDTNNALFNTLTKASSLAASVRVRAAGRRCALSHVFCTAVCKQESVLDSSFAEDTPELHGLRGQSIWNFKNGTGVWVACMMCARVVGESLTYYYPPLAGGKEGTGSGLGLEFYLRFCKNNFVTGVNSSGSISAPGGSSTTRVTRPAPPTDQYCLSALLLTAVGSDDGEIAWDPECATVSVGLCCCLLEVVGVAITRALSL